MAKAAKKKSSKEASNTFHSIMQASVKGNSQKIKNYDFTHRIGGKQFHFKKDSDTKYSITQIPITGVSFFAEKNGNGDWCIYGCLFDTKVDTLIKHNEEAKKNQ